ncbi:hypothetical protein OZX72_00730 [Bifidobacterium sp. ESL0769]|uniref:hypothetical protein n=1 Tax=Bifidobacterium sp. ESL0769 TaxID=2983229 RepID=UPI0023F9400D|nr:hypothetical protein [Bifidobacterium sp. ESL0769]WEV67564.1 hypothetical protein OZX72_00730 [Bifidobacterium sp. ESL0769]
MAEINVNKKKLDKLIKQIRDLSTDEFGAGEVMGTTDMQGAQGASMTALHQTEEEYPAIAASMRTLFSNTADFLEQAGKLMEFNDMLSAQQFNA